MSPRVIRTSSAYNEGCSRDIVVESPELHRRIVHEVALKTGVCEYCLCRGHVKADCPLQKRERPASAIIGACHACGEKGHFAHECPRRKAAGRGADRGAVNYVRNKGDADKADRW